MIIIPEKHVNRWLPDPNGETQLVNRFASAGFRVIDPSMYAAMRKGANFKAAVNDPLAAASIGSEFGADVIIVGEGVSQRTGNRAGMTVCRATTRAKAIQVSTAQILMSYGAEQGGVDVSESAAANVALRAVGDEIAAVFLEKFCEGNLQLNGDTDKTATTVVRMVNTDFSKIQSLTNAISKVSSIKEVKRSSFAGDVAVLEVKHEGSTDEVINALAENANNLCNITGIEGNEVEVTMK